MYVVEEQCPFSLNEDHCDELCAVPVSGETVHRGVKCHNEGISLNLIRTQHSRSSHKCPEAMFMCEHLGVSPGSNEKESVTGALLEP